MLAIVGFERNLYIVPENDSLTMEICAVLLPPPALAEGVNLTVMITFADGTAVGMCILSTLCGRGKRKEGEGGGGRMREAGGGGRRGGEEGEGGGGRRKEGEGVGRRREETLITGQNVMWPIEKWQEMSYFRNTKLHVAT